MTVADADSKPRPTKGAPVEVSQEFPDSIVRLLLQDSRVRCSLRHSSRFLPAQSGHVRMKLSGSFPVGFRFIRRKTQPLALLALLAALVLSAHAGTITCRDSESRRRGAQTSYGGLPCNHFNASLKSGLTRSPSAMQFP